jgi:hypothetical protein
MIVRELTRSTSPATSRPMGEWQTTVQGSGGRAVRAGALLVAGSLALSGCISVTAPDKPIVIELNINIKQEVVYRLSADAANTIDKNPEIF